MTDITLNKKFTLKQWLNEWIELYCINLKENTYTSYKQIIQCHISRVLGDMPLNELSVKDIQIFYNKL